MHQDAPDTIIALQSMAHILSEGQQLLSGMHSGKSKPKLPTAAPVIGLPTAVAEAVLQLLSMHAALSKLRSPKG